MPIVRPFASLDAICNVMGPLVTRSSIDPEPAHGLHYGHRPPDTSAYLDYPAGMTGTIPIESILTQ